MRLLHGDAPVEVDRIKARESSDGLANILRGSKWSKETARCALEAWVASGESLSVSARRHSIHRDRIRWWRDRLGKPSAPMTLVPMVAVAEPRRSSRASAAVVIRCGNVGIDVDAGVVGPDWCAAMVAALARESR